MLSPRGPLNYLLETGSYVEFESTLWQGAGALISIPTVYFPSWSRIPCFRNNYCGAWRPINPLNPKLV
jgi:hypothetical protein